MKQTLLGKTLPELQQVALSVGLQKFAGKQLAEWLYVRRATSFEQMTNISLKGRQALEEQYTIGRHNPVAEAVSKDGTKKYLFRLSLQDGKGDVYIESVYIPDNDRATLCVSTQAGCKMGCKFCMTGTLGFHGQLPDSEILNQIFSIPDADKLTNIVYMGEGEPMDNIDHVLRSLQVMTEPWGCAWSPKRITVSTVGVVPGLERFLKESECHLAVSLHNPFGAERQDIMPIEKRYHLTDVVAMLKQYDWQHQRRVSFEYICWHGQNDTLRHANELVRLLKGLPCRMNLIRFHAGVDQAFASSDEKQMEWLRDYLSDHGITTTIRRSRGEDILAACGMLVNALSQK
jgi:23S rRNA (adenine2503-C2)-methyltransferase